MYKAKVIIILITLVQFSCTEKLQEGQSIAMNIGVALSLLSLTPMNLSDSINEFDLIRLVIESNLSDSEKKGYVHDISMIDKINRENTRKGMMLKISVSGNCYYINEKESFGCEWLEHLM